MKRQAVAAVCLAVTAIALAVTLLVSGGSPPDTSNHGSALAASVLEEMPLARISAAPSAQTVYVLREYEGQIAVYVSGDTENPVLLTGILTSSLRKTDRELLQEGISARGDEELAKLLEDFGS